MMVKIHHSKAMHLQCAVMNDKIIRHIRKLASSFNSATWKFGSNLWKIWLDEAQLAKK